MIRQPTAAGQFYPSSPIQLRTIIEALVDNQAEKEPVLGLLSPHAGYVYSGSVAGATFSNIMFKDTFIIIGPNHTGMGKQFSIMTQGAWRTPLGDVPIDSELGKIVLSLSSYLEEDHLAHQYEHSIEVQLPFLQYFNKDVKIVPICLGLATGAIYHKIGQEIAQTIRQSNKDTIILASSDMTHYESHESAKKKDTQAIDAILKLDWQELLQRIEELSISMCGYAPAVCLISAAKTIGANQTKLVKYQTSGETSGDYSSVVGYAGLIITELSPLTRLAKEAVEVYIREGKTIPPPNISTPKMREAAGVFVSIHKSGDLRGCIGTFEPTKNTVAEEIITNAISSATRDPRFPPIAPEELPILEYSIDVLDKAELVENETDLDPKKYGLIVQSDFRRGLLLPDLEGVDTVDQQVEICRMKAGIGPNEPIRLYRFRVTRYH